MSSEKPIGNRSYVLALVTKTVIDAFTINMSDKSVSGKAMALAELTEGTTDQIMEFFREP